MDRVDLHMRCDETPRLLLQPLAHGCRHHGFLVRMRMQDGQVEEVGADARLARRIDLERQFAAASVHADHGAG